MENHLKNNRKAILFGFWILYVGSFNLIILDLGVLPEAFLVIFPLIISFAKESLDKVSDLFIELEKYVFKKWSDLKIFTFLSFFYLAFFLLLIFLKIGVFNKYKNGNSV